MAPTHGAHCLCEDCRPWSTRNPEREKVEDWRLHVLLEAGYSVQVAKRVAESSVDLHRAVELVARGCAPAVAALILL